jgi:multicomponent Na+:H+ antiporter subunit G
VSDVIGGLLLIAGAVFVLIGAIGVVRFATATERLHAAAKGPTLGLMLLGAGTAVHIGPSAIVPVILIVLLQLLAGPLGSHMIGRAVHSTPSPPPTGGDGVDP